MNCDTVRQQQSIEQHKLKAGTVDQYRQHVLKSMQLKAVIKESHCSPVQSLSFNHTDPSLYNLFATLGKDQATIYDDQHMGQHLAVVVHFLNKQTKFAPGGELCAAAWVNANDCTHAHGDALLAVGGADCCVSVVSVVESRVVALLQGHKRRIVDVAAARQLAGRVASLSEDAECRVWAAQEEQCSDIVQCAPGSGALALSPDGTQLLVATRAAQPLQCYSISSSGGCLESQAALKVEGSPTEGKVECLKYVTEQHVVARAGCHLWRFDASTGALAAAWKVPGSSSVGGVRCQFGATSDGGVIVAGNGTGDVFIFDGLTGKRLATCAGSRVSAPVRAAGVSEDCRHVLAVLGNGYVFRYEFREPAAEAVAVDDQGHSDKENVCGNVAMLDEEAMDAD